MIQVAIVGPDGAGKSTVVRLLKARLGDRAVVVYMGQNPRSGGAALPTTRLRERLRPRGRPQDAERLPEPSAAARQGGPMALAPVRVVWSMARLANRIAEATLRHVRARRLQRAGRIVLRDRDFLLDYDATDVRPDRVSLERRIHGLVLLRLPKPDLVVLLDAPGEVLHARKGEWSVAYLNRRRNDYQVALRHVGRSVIIDATAPLEAIVDRIVLEIDALVETRRAERSAGRTE